MALFCFLVDKKSDNGEQSDNSNKRDSKYDEQNNLKETVIALISSLLYPDP